MNTANLFSNVRNRVMVVDDDPVILAMVRAILVQAGCAVIPVATGEAALAVYTEEFIAHREVPLVVLDLTLPGGMTGLETLQAIKGLDPEARVIASSGYFDESSAQAARQKGFFGILPKPYTVERLLKLVNWGLDRTAAPSVRSEAGQASKAGHLI